MLLKAEDIDANKLVELYLDWYNNYTSFQTFADHYGISKRLAQIIITRGKIIHANVSVAVLNIKDADKSS